jgi:nitroreductase
MEQGSWLDYGMFLQNILIAANARGIGSCPQAAFISYHKIVAQHLGFSPDEQLVCCISLGYENTEAPENQLITERTPVTEFVQFMNT